MVYPATNDSTDWDWIIWETRGNPDPRYQRGGTTRKLGLYRLSYHRLRKAGGAAWATNRHADRTLGGGWIKVAALDSVDYGNHRELIDTFLPCFSIDRDGHLVEPVERVVPEISVLVRRVPRGTDIYNTVEVSPPVIVLPYNYDDNALDSGATGTKLRSPSYVNDFGALRLTDELDRWATASRSSIAAFEGGGVRGALYPYGARERDDWPFRIERSNTDQKIDGPPGGVTLIQYQAANPTRRFYSVKTGVQFVGRENQKEPNAKDKLEGNSIHAMTRSNLIAGTMSRLGAGVFEASYQIEVLSILFGKDGQFDGIQVREVSNAALGSVWFPALAIPSHGKAFVRSWAPGQDWLRFWEQNFARPLGRAKGEMLCYFGLQHMTSNAQNFLIAFDRGSPGSAKQRVILRDLGDTIYNNHFFDVLKTTASPALYNSAWNDEIADAVNGLVLGGNIGGGYFNPRMTRTGASIVFFFGPFRKVDLGTDADLGLTRTLARWCIAHNYGFLDYFCEKVGYRPDWQPGPDNVPADLADPLRKHCRLDNSNAGVYPGMVPRILALNSTARWRQIRLIESEIAAAVLVENGDAGDRTKLENLVNAHEVLICAEIEKYIQSPAGANALRGLHAGSPVISPHIMPGPACAKCRTLANNETLGWHKCETCKSVYCGVCVRTLPFPRGTVKAMEAFTIERRCPDCSQFTGPIPR